jgi:thermostable 8-oxoguanine DNA glycosylase
LPLREILGEVRGRILRRQQEILEEGREGIRQLQEILEEVREGTLRRQEILEEVRGGILRPDLRRPRKQMA